MSKLVLGLALYAAGAATWLLLSSCGTGERGGGGPSVQEIAAGEEARTEHLRQLMFEARHMLREEVKEVVRNIDWRLAKMDALRKSMDEGLAATQRAAEQAAQGSFGKLEAMDEQLGRLKDLTGRLAALDKSLAAQEKRIVALEQRPAQVVRESGGAPTPAPVEPPRPTLPTEPDRDPEVVAQEITKARQDLASDNIDLLFPAIEKVREHRVLEAVPRLMEIMSSFRDEFGRAAAAAALGKMEIVDAVPGLAEALVDKSDLVALQAGKALRQVTGFDLELSATARIRERRTARNRFKEWWRENEAQVRARHEQPGGAVPEPPR